MTERAEIVAANVWFTLAGRALSVIAVPALGWLIITVISIQADVRVLTTTITFSTADHYRGEDARRDFQLRDLRLSTVETRVQELEHEVRANKLELKTLAPPR